MLRLPKVILDTVPEGPLTRDARSLRDLLLDTARTALVLVTLPEEMPANEARELAHTLESDVGITVASLIINQVYPDRFPAESAFSAVLEALVAGTSNADPKSDALAALAAHGELQRSRRRLNETHLAELARSFSTPGIELPYLFVPAIGPQEIQALSQMLEEELAGTDNSRSTGRAS